MAMDENLSLIIKKLLLKKLKKTQVKILRISLLVITDSDLSLITIDLDLSLFGSYLRCKSIANSGG